VLLKADVSEAGEGWSDSRIVKALDTSLATVARTRQRLVEEGFDAVLTRKHSPNSARKRVFDGAAEAKLIALACSEPPKGRSRWTLTLLESVRKVSYWVTQFSEHETDGRKAYESHRHRGQVLKILGETAASIEPCEGSLDNPPAWQDFETFGRIRPLHDRDGKPRQCLRQRVTEFRTLISAVSEQLLKERIKAEHGGHDIHPSVTVLDVRRVNDCMQQQSYRIDEDMPLLSLDLLAGIVTIRIDAAPPFSALFTLWLSITQAVGLTSRPICSRHSM
jgi:hypothetical protein